jgi:hypothetical protein
MTGLHEPAETLAEVAAELEAEMTTFDIHEGRSRSLWRKPEVSSGGAVGGGVGPYDSRFSLVRLLAEFVCGARGQLRT